jgi:hypothetical protein
MQKINRQVRLEEGAKATVKVMGPLESTVQKILDYEKQTVQWLSLELGFDKIYINQQISLERTGSKKISGKLLRTLERKYEGLLTGEKTIIGTENELVQGILEEQRAFKASLVVILETLAELRSEKQRTAKATELAYLTGRTADLVDEMKRAGRS